MLFKEAVENLTPDNLDVMVKLYDDGAVFIHPFKTAIGKPGIGRQWKMMFKYCPATTIEVTDIQRSDEAYYVKWKHSFTPPHGTDRVSIEGSSIVEYKNGLIYQQTDIFDLNHFYSLF